MNTHDLDVLRALARLSRMRKTVDCESLALRSGGSLDDARASLARLARVSLVVESDTGPRLTMAGLAIAVASASFGASGSRVASSAPANVRTPRTERAAARRRAA